ncbi:MAG: hypothetical protein HY063_00110 [Bacteroidetes bacterium]|nr:hypothetical protein [Bacteroidota bacterium]
MRKKKFDSVKMMREIRNKLSKRWAKNPEQEMADLERIRSKYKIRKRTKKHAA